MNIQVAPQPALRSLFAGIAGLFGFIALPSVSPAALVSSWTQNVGTNGSNLNTASPVLGNGTTGSESADGQQIYASTASAYTLSTVGDSITLSGGVTFTGLNAAQSDQFRFGLYDSNGQSGITGWLGYFATNSGGGGNPNGRLWERDAGNTTGYGSNGTGSASQRMAVAGTPANTFASGAYTFSLTATRTAAGLEVAWSIIGTSLTYSISGTYSDTTPLTYSFDRVGIFTGGALNADQVSFSNIDVTYVSAVPEPASWAALAAGLALAFACLRRRARA